MASEEEGDMALMYTTIASNGTVGPEVQIDKRACECCKTSVATTPGMSTLIWMPGYAFFSSTRRFALSVFSALFEAEYAERNGA